MTVRDRIKSLRRVKASKLKANPRNWRRHPAEQRAALSGILEEVGYADACLARELSDGSLELVDGHLRADLDPERKVPVLILDVDEAEAAKLLTVLDPLAGMAEANEEALGKLLAEIETESEALQAMLEGLANENGIDVFEPGAVEEVEPQIDRVTELQRKWGTEAGQLWVIPSKTVEGKSHRVLCGDSTKVGDVERLMGGQRAGVCFTSPPYAQQREYTKKIHDWDALMRGVFGELPMNEEGQVLVNLGLIHRDCEWVPYWDGWIEWMRAQGWRRFGWYVWDQGSGLPGDWSGRFAPSHEWVFHFNRENIKPHKTVPKNPASGPMGTNLRRASGENGPAGSICHDINKVPDSVVRVNRNSSHGTGHPATFPVMLPRWLVACWDGIVYEPFLGAGTTMVAAEQLGRLCYGIEIAPQYVAVILERMTDLGLEPIPETAEAT